MFEARVERLSGIRAAAAPRTASAVRNGAVAGLAAGAAMAVYVILAALIAGEPVLLAFRAIAEGTPGLTVDSRGAALAGVLVHAAMSAALGIVFAAVLPRDSPPMCAAGLGVGYAFLAMGLLAGLILPDGFVRALHDIGGSWVIAHAVYGAVLGLGLSPRRRAAVSS